MRALITSGGGAKGAFTVGALTVLIRERGIDRFDIISGTSTGALIAGMIAAGKIAELRQIYTSVQNDDILRQQNLIRNLLENKPHIFDSSPLEQMIQTHIDQQAFNQIMASGSKLYLTAISLQSGRITVFSTHDIPSTQQYDVRRIQTLKQLQRALLASSNQAAFLPPVPIANAQGVEEQFVDGGNREVIPALAVIDHVPAPDEIFVLSNNPSVIEPIGRSYQSILDVLMRAISIFIQDVRENDLAGLDALSGPTTTIHYIEPTHDLDPDYPTGLRFDPLAMGTWMAQGEHQARQVLAGGVTRRSRRLLARTPRRPLVEGVASISGSTRCTALTADGDRCKNNTFHASGLCHAHRGAG